MPKIINVKTGKPAGYMTSEEWDRVKNNPQYNKVLKAEPGLEDLPEIKEMREEQKTKKKKTATVPPVIDLPTELEKDSEKE